MKYGRHIVTKTALKVGDIVSIETPFCGVLLSESKMLQIPQDNIHQRCSNCLKENALDLIPCQNCSKGEGLISGISSVILILDSSDVLFRRL
jgi:hypothetical protein